MGSVEPIAWTDGDRVLWARIAAHDFEGPGAALTFADRLARDHGWSLFEARAAIDEYRRFCFLAMRAGREVTPSEEVDEVWHQHLTYSRDYWQIWCRDVLRRDLHHGPTLGGAAENRRFVEQYAETLAAYEAWFGPPPASFWPGTSERFGAGSRFQIVDRRRSFVFSVSRSVGDPARRVKRLLGLGTILSLCLLLPASAASFDPLDWTAGPFLALYIVLVAVSLLAAYELPLRLASLPESSPRRPQLMPVELAFLAAGRTHAADVLNLEAMAAGNLSIKATRILVEGAEMTRGVRAQDLSERIDAIWSRMADDGLAVSAEQLRSIRRATLAIVLPVLVFGLIKVIVAQARDRPVGDLIGLMVITLVSALVIAGLRRPASKVGSAALKTYKDENDRALRAPKADEVIAAFACIGAAVLVGTEFAPYAALLNSQAGGSGGCGGGGCSGGGGCGGCGS